MIIKKQISKLIPPFITAGILLILLPIFTLMTLDRMQKQKESIKERLVEKGISLIRTFEAGTRTGMLTMQWGARRVQAMLLETACQPEVIYIAITSKDGQILAHSNDSMVGGFFHAIPNLQNIENNTVSHRIRQYNDNVPVFEVFKKFTPLRKVGPRHKRIHEIKENSNDEPDRFCLHKKGLDSGPKLGRWCMPYLNGSKTHETAEHYIFAGLSMARAKKAQKKLLRETIGLGIIFFVIGFVGMTSLFAFQAYMSAKASLTSVQAFSDNVVQNMPSGLITINLENEITSVNKAARNILGPDLKKTFPQMTRLVHETGKPEKTITREIAFEIPGTGSVRLEMTASPIRDNENNTLGVLFLFRDLTQIKELKKEIKTSRHLASIGKLAAGVAHEIRNPLSSIKGFATYFEKRYEKDSDDYQTAGIMIQEVERINRSITQLLEFAKPMSIAKKNVDLEKLIYHSLKLVQYDLDYRTIETRVRIRTEDKKINSDPDRINQIFLNLYINAFQSMGNGGKLTIEVSDSDEGFVQITVKDNGEGISRENIDDIFDPYFTTRSDGNGLGLSIVHNIIQNLKGNIKVKSKKGEGTSFIITLPRI